MIENLRRHVLLLMALLVVIAGKSQDVKTKLTEGLKRFQLDEQCKHAAIGFVVKDADGAIVMDYNSELGFAPASCQKVVTGAAALDLLGKDFIYTTTLAYDGSIINHVLNGNLYLNGSGDPTLGSPRWAATTEQAVMDKLLKALQDAGIEKVNGDIIIDRKGWPSNTIPDGWVWEDIGNYYGAGADIVNWRENQYDLLLQSGNEGEAVKITGTKPSSVLKNINWVNELKAGTKGSGDNAYIYLPPYGNTAYVRGTIPPNQNSFTVAGSIPDPSKFMKDALTEGLLANNIIIVKQKATVSPKQTTLVTIASPSLENIMYWFLKKSINLYGEALVKTIAYKMGSVASTDSGIIQIKNYWAKKGIEKSSINIIDGSGLSPANRLTPNALVSILQYAKKQPWYNSFYNALPEMNGIKMKDGYISSVRSYTGYIKSKTGAEYSFAFIINNFDGSAGTIREKIWKLLDMMK